MGKSRSNILPVLDNLVTLGTDSNHSILQPLSHRARAAFQNLNTLGTNSNHSTLFSSGFQFLGSGLTIVLKNFSDVYGLTEGESNVVTQTVLKSFSDVYGLTESKIEGILEQRTSSLLIDVLGYEQRYSTLIIKTSQLEEQVSALRVNVVAHDVPPVVDYTSASNPFQPTVLINGAVVHSNPSTLPSYIPPTANDTIFLESPISGVDACNNLLDFSMNLDYSGGSWQTFSKTSITGTNTRDVNLGQTVSVFGMAGYINRWGERFDAPGSGIGYQTKGIFGSPNMNKALDILLANDSLTFGLLTNQNASNAKIENWQSYENAANTIALSCGATIFWNIRDFVLTDFFASEGSNALNALGSLAAQAGGTLRWNGGTRYMVCYPDFFSGLWSVPNDRLLLAHSYEWIQDLETGVSGTGVVGLPIMRNNDFSQLPLPSNNIAGSRVEGVLAIRNVIKSGEPPHYQKLENDVYQVFIQVLVEPGTTSSSTFVTSDKTQWFPLATLPIGNQYVHKVYDNGAWINELMVDSSLFPNLPNNKFSLNIGVVRYDQSETYAAAVAERDAVAKQVLARSLGQFQYIKVYEGTITTAFFGSIPMPGMWGTATNSCGKTVEGVIESVSFANKQITINVAQYKLVDYLQNYVKIQGGSIV